MALKPAPQKPKFNTDKAVSWSYFSSFRDYDKEEWYQHYILGKPTATNPEMEFGNKAGKSFCTNNPLAPVTRYAIMEHEVRIKSLNGIKLLGFLDSYRKDSNEVEYIKPDGTIKKFELILNRGIREYKTGKKTKPWTQKRVDQHDQITFYCLLVYLSEGIRPEELDIHLDWYPTVRDEKYKVQFVPDIENNIKTFKTTRTLAQIIKFDNEIAKVYKEMQVYVANHK